jgi:hypothetical protein
VPNSQRVGKEIKSTGTQLDMGWTQISEYPMGLDVVLQQYEEENHMLD